jgi:hypothetical protein
MDEGDKIGRSGGEYGCICCGIGREVCVLGVGTVAALLGLDGGVISWSVKKREVPQACGGRAGASDDGVAIVSHVNSGGSESSNATGIAELFDAAEGSRFKSGKMCAIRGDLESWSRSSSAVWLKQMVLPPGKEIGMLVVASLMLRNGALMGENWPVLPVACLDDVGSWQSR